MARAQIVQPQRHKRPFPGNGIGCWLAGWQHTDRPGKKKKKKKLEKNDASRQYPPDIPRTVAQGFHRHQQQRQRQKWRGNELVTATRPWSHMPRPKAKKKGPCQLQDTPLLRYRRRPFQHLPQRGGSRFVPALVRDIAQDSPRQQQTKRKRKTNTSRAADELPSSLPGRT